MKKSIKWLAIVFSLVTSIVTSGAVPSFAYYYNSEATSEQLEAGVGDTRGKVGIAFLGYGEKPETPNSISAIKTLNGTASNLWANKDKPFWVGFYIADMNKADSNIPSGALATDTKSGGAKKISSYFLHKEDGVDEYSEGGMYSYTVGITYDSNVIEPVFPEAYQVSKGKKRTISDYATYLPEILNDFSNWKDGQGDDREIAADPNSTSIDQILGSTGSEVAKVNNGKVNSALINSEDLPVFLNYDSDYDYVNSMTNDAYFLIVQRFKIKSSVTDKPDDGTVIIEPTLNKNQFTIRTGSGNTKMRWSGAWDATRSATATKNIKNLLNYVAEDDPQFFPASAPSAPTVSAATISGWPSWVGTDGDSDGKPDTDANGKLLGSIEHGTSLALGSFKVTLKLSDNSSSEEKTIAELMTDYPGTTVKIGTNTYSSAADLTGSKGNADFDTMDGQEIVITIPGSDKTTGGTAVEAKLGKLNISNPVQSIAIKAQPKTNYGAGDTLDFTSMVISKVLKSGKTEDVSGTAALSDSDFSFTIDGTPVDASTKVNKASHDGKKISVKYKTFPAVETNALSVSAATVSSISVSQDPSKMSDYVYGEKYNLTGLKITVTYSDSTSTTLTYGGTKPEEAKSNFSFKINGTDITDGSTIAKVADSGKAIEVTYGGKSANTGNVTVEKKELSVPSTLQLGDFTITTADYTTKADGKYANKDLDYSPASAAINAGLISGLLDADKGSVTVNYTVTTNPPRLFANDTKLDEEPKTLAVSLALATGGVNDNYKLASGSATGSIKIIVTDDPVKKLETDSTSIPASGFELDLSNAADETLAGALAAAKLNVFKLSNVDANGEPTAAGRAEVSPQSISELITLGATVKVIDDGVASDASGTTRVTPTMTALVVNYRGQEITVPLNVKNPVTAVAVAGGPTKAFNSYEHGDSFDLSGLTVQLTYAYKSDGTNAKKETYAYNELPAGASLEIKLSDTANTDLTSASAKADRDSMNGKDISLKYTDSDTPSGVTNANAATLTVAAATGTISADGASGTSISDSATDVSGLTKPNFTVTATNGAQDKTQGNFKVYVFKTAPEAADVTDPTTNGKEWTTTFPESDFGTYYLVVTYTDGDGNFTATNASFTYEATQRRTGGGSSSSGTKQVVNVNPTEEPPVEEEDTRLIVDIPDIPDTDADDVYMKGYVRRNGEHTFRPSLGVTRAEVAMLIARLMPDFDESKTYDSNLDFPDVPQDEWYKDAVAYAVNKGLVNGYNNNTFRPDRTISRQEFAAIIARYLDIQPEGIAEYTDTSDTVDVWATGYINQLSKVWLRQGEGTEPFEGQILNGYNDGSFRPRNNITRAEVTKVLNRVFGRIPNEEKMESYLASHEVDLEDVSKDYWAYYEILEASVEHIHGDFH